MSAVVRVRHKVYIELRIVKPATEVRREASPPIRTLGRRTKSELVVDAARSVRRPPRWPLYCAWAWDAAILGVTVSNGRYLRAP